MEKTGKRSREGIEAEDSRGNKNQRTPDGKQKLIWISQCFIPIDTWDIIVSFLNIPELGKTAQVCKELNKTVMKDGTWQHHLRKLLQKVFDGAFYVEPKMRYFWRNHMPVPISKRPLKSTNFRLWYTDWAGLGFTHEGRAITYDTLYKSAVMGSYEGPNGQISICDITTAVRNQQATCCRWLVEAVPLRTYYKKAGEFAWMGYIQHRESLGDDDNCYDSDNDMYDYDGVYLGADHEMFRGLPNIRLFHRRGGNYRHHSFYRYDSW